MKLTKLLLSILSIVFSAHLSYAQKVLNAEESNPNKMGWMQGFPPPKDRIISATDGSFFTFPALRYSVCHMREFVPTTVVESTEGKRYVFKQNLDANIDNISFYPTNSDKPMTWAESLPINYTDGILILHKGKIIYEKYFGGLKPDGIHAVMSVSKTFTGTLGGLLVAEGILDENKMASEYVPALKNSAFGDATIRQILDMTTALKYSEDYSDPNAEIWDFTAAGNPFVPISEENKYSNFYDYLVTVQKDGTHGEVFGYKTINTDVMGWIISAVTNKSIPQLLSERIWRPLGTHFEGYYQIDKSGIAFAGGGFNANLRDLAMFGEMVLNNGMFNKKQILPHNLIEDIRSHGDKKAFQKSSYGTSLKGWSYRDMWWVTNNANGAFAARGVHGQTIYIDSKAEMVIVRLASHPEAKNSKIDPTSLPAYQAVADYLLKK